MKTWYIEGSKYRDCAFKTFGDGLKEKEMVSQ